MPFLWYTGRWIVEIEFSHIIFRVIQDYQEQTVLQGHQEGRLVFEFYILYEAPWLLHMANGTAGSPLYRLTKQSVFYRPTWSIFLTNPWFALVVASACWKNFNKRTSLRSILFFHHHGRKSFFTFNPFSQYSLFLLDIRRRLKPSMVRFPMRPCTLVPVLYMTLYFRFWFCLENAHILGKLNEVSW